MIATASVHNNIMLEYMYMLVGQITIIAPYIVRQWAVEKIGFLQLNRESVQLSIGADVLYRKLTAEISIVCIYRKVEQEVYRYTVHKQIMLY